MEGRRLAVVLIVTSCLSALTVGDTRSIPDVCLQPVVVGPCRGKFPHYYFNSVLGTCQLFDYGGCRGNENRFKKMDACLKTCEYPWRGILGY
uniref:Serine protease inhibitor n=1 Tax=Conus buxeus loroisii TaxID=410709 RepID=A0A0Y0NC93_CONBL|nr:serine protease inhibitor [Conus buxeus loroisii]